MIAGLAGCTAAGTDTTTSSSRPASAAASSSVTHSASPTPALQTKVGDKSAQITLDSGFTAALKKLGLTAGVVGDGRLSDRIAVDPQQCGH